MTRSEIVAVATDVRRKNRINPNWRSQVTLAVVKAAKRARSPIFDDLDEIASIVNEADRNIA